MVIHRLELCITMVRLAIEFVVSVAETVVIVQQRTAEPLGTLNRASTPLPFYGYLRWVEEYLLFIFFSSVKFRNLYRPYVFFSFWVHQTLIDANPVVVVVRKIDALFFSGFWLDFLYSLNPVSFSAYNGLRLKIWFFFSFLIFWVLIETPRCPPAYFLDQRLIRLW